MSAIMSTPHVTAEITLTSFHPSPVGGGVLIGRDPRDELRRTVLSPHVAPRDPEDGETWRITGVEEAHERYGIQIHASVALPLLPSGRTIVRYLATNRRFAGIGWKTAGRLWDALGERLYDALARNDLPLLADVIGPDRAVEVVQGFGLLAEEIEVFRWLDRYGVSPRTAAAAAALWGRGAIERIQADPYMLVLLEPWKVVDARALRLGLALDDDRRLLAAVDEALARRYKAGHTAATVSEVRAQLWNLLQFTAHRVGDRPIEKAVTAGRVILHPSGLLQSRAASFMEREIERLLAERLRRQPHPAAPGVVEAALAAEERAAGHPLSPRQREAVHMAVSCPLSIICGGAGTGKTTSVKAVLAASEACRGALPPGERDGFRYAQVALAGRAAKRIAEATGREASTVARFLAGIESGGRKPKRGLVILDESSMLDVPSVYRILVALPPEVDLLVIGDPGQLPPIGPGLPFRRMIATGAIPKVELDVVHRQTEASGIPAVAAAIRSGRLPALPRFDPARPLARGVFLIPATPEHTGAAAVTAFRAMVGSAPPPMRTSALHQADVQILCPVKNGPGGIKAINETIEAEWMVHQPRIANWGLSIGSKVMWLRNDYTKAPVKDAQGNSVTNPATGEPVCVGFMNGSLGVIKRATAKGAWLELDGGSADEIALPDLERLTGGWAISIHKAQGSSFRRVIVPVARSRLLDRSLLYTAVTRAVDTCVLVGDPDVLRAAIEAPPFAHKRSDCLDIEAALAEMEA